MSCIPLPTSAWPVGQRASSDHARAFVRGAGWRRSGHAQCQRLPARRQSSRRHPPGFGRQAGIIPQRIPARQILRHLPQPAPENGRADAWTTPTSRTSATIPKSGRRSFEASRQPDAAAGPAAPGRRRVQAFPVVPRDLARSGGGSKPDPGRTEALHRLNRVEYRNAVRDLLALDIDVSSHAAGRRCELRVRQYRWRAADVADADGAIHRGRAEDQRRRRRRVAAGGDHGHVSRSARAPAGRSRRWAAVRHSRRHQPALYIPTRRRIRRSRAVDALRRRQLRRHSGLRRDAEARAQRRWRAAARLRAASDNAGDGPGPNRRALDAEWQVRFPAKAGPRTVALTFLNRAPALLENLLEPFQKPVPGGPNGYYTTQKGAYLRTIEITGPFNADRSWRYAEPATDLRLPADRAQDNQDEAACAKKILSALARRAFRRPVSDSDLQSLLSFYEEGHGQEEGAGVRDGNRARSRRSPRQPRVPVPHRTRTPSDGSRRIESDIYRISDLELASRLSFFLWSSIPDEALLEAASSGKLRNPAVLEQQVRRMLADPRADALVSNFVGQWLFLRNLPAVLPDPRKDPDFDEDLRQGFRRETEMFAGSIFRENRSVLDLLTAQLHVRERAPRQALRHPEHPRHAFPPRGAQRREPPRAAGPRKHSVGHLFSESDVTGRARQMDPRKPARQRGARIRRRMCPP